MFGHEFDDGYTTAMMPNDACYLGSLKPEPELRRPPTSNHVPWDHGT